MRCGAIVRVAVPSPLRRLFDYRAPANVPPGGMQPGMRVRVPFGRAARVGVIVECAAASTLPAARLKSVLEVLDEVPVLPPDILALSRWSSAYYHHPPGEVMAVALPGLLRRGRPAQGRGVRRWRLSRQGAGIPVSELARAPRQAALLGLLAEHPQGLTAGELGGQLAGGWRTALHALNRKGWVEACSDTRAGSLHPPASPGQVSAVQPECRPAPDAAQADAIEAVSAAQGHFQVFLLDGVTGSGKTEVYLNLIESSVHGGRQALVLVPEIGLTPQMVARFRARLRVPVVLLHSALSDQERLQAWLAARDGVAPVVIGTRSAVFAPLARPGLFIVDEEHDLSFKQQDGFRYSARDLAVVRAREAGVPVVLGSATPSLESLYNVERGRYRWLHLPRRAGGATEPSIRVVDVRGRPFAEGFSSELLNAIAATLARGEQTLLFLNRRGYAPLLLCHDCGWIAECARCDAHLVYHRGAGRLRCHHCGAERPAPESCPSCTGSDLRALGSGTERTVQALGSHFPQARIARLDRDSTRRKGALESVLERIGRGEVDILVGTQMIAKGHHFPDVTLVGVLDADGGLFGVDFRASERMAQLVVQVAGRAGRAERPGTVLIQTHHPEHPLLHALLRRGYASFARSALAERREAELPPVSWQALLRAEAPGRESVATFLEDAHALAQPLCTGGVRLLGPVPAPMERRAGRYRAQLLLEAGRRRALQGLLAIWAPKLEELRSGRRVRWSLDVDPQEMV